MSWSLEKEAALRKLVRDGVPYADALHALSDDEDPKTAMRDGDKLVAWVREAADELEKAHAILDAHGVPRSLPGADAECTLAARIALALGKRAFDEDRDD